MPICSQDNIFSAINENRAELAIIFGHIGFNEMGPLWVNFAQQIDTFAHVSNPFSSLAGRPVRIPNGTWLWFVAEQENHGIARDALVPILDNIFTWVQEKGIHSVITNGVADIDHGRTRDANRYSDDMRARFLMQDANAREGALGISIELTSLNDVFIRNVKGL